MSDNGQEETQHSILIIEFAAPGSAEFRMKSNHVSPAQIMSAAAWLNWYAQQMFEQTARQEAAKRIQVPGIAVDLKKLHG